MAAQKHTRDTGIGISFFVSAVIHLAVFLLLFWWNALFPVKMVVETTYYVDVVNLPVASPQAGNPAQSVNTAVNTTEAPPPPVPDKNMSLPEPPKPRVKSLPVKTQKTLEKVKTPDESKAFAEKLAKLAKSAESRHQEETLERLRRKVAATGNGRAGAPGSGGSQAGSDYLNYITSRISEVFSEPPNTSNDIFTVIKIKINSRGKVELLKTIRSSGDIAFDNYAVKSIYEAEKKFQPPPTGSFEFTFRFRPQGISNR